MSEQIKLQEMRAHWTLCDAAQMIDDIGIELFLEQLPLYCDSPYAMDVLAKLLAFYRGEN